MTRLLDNLPPGGDFLSSMNKKGTTGRKRSSLGMGPFRENPLAPLKSKSTVSSESNDSKTPQEEAVKTTPTESGTNAVQMRYNGGTKQVNAVQTEAPSETICGTKSGTNAVQTRSPTFSTDISSLRTIRGNYRRVLLGLYARCRKRGQRTTADLCLIDFAQETQISYESIRTTLRRMLEKGFLLRTGFSTGRGGWVEYEIPELIYRALLDMETSNIGWPEMRNLCGTNGGSISGQIASCSSSENLNTTTTETNDTEEKIKEERLRELSAVDLSRWGIRRHALLGYVGVGKLCENRQELEEFLHRAKVAIDDLRSRGEPVRSPAGFLMHCLKAGYVGVPDGYKSLEEEQLEVMNREMRQRLENIKAAKKEKYQIEYEIFKETVDQARKSTLMKEIEGKLDINRSIVGESAYARAISAKLEESMMDVFVQQYEPAELRGEVLKFIMAF